MNREKVTRRKRVVWEWRALMASTHRVTISVMNVKQLTYEVFIILLNRFSNTIPQMFDVHSETGYWAIVWYCLFTFSTNSQRSLSLRVSSLCRKIEWRLWTQGTLIHSAEKGSGDLFEMCFIIILQLQAAEKTLKEQGLMKWLPLYPLTLKMDRPFFSPRYFHVCSYCS